MQNKSYLASSERIEQSHLREIENESEAELTFGFQVSTSSICDLFQEVAQALGFEMIEKQLLHATAIKQVKKNFLHYIDCFNWVTEGNMTAIKMTIHIIEKNSTRKCKVKGLVGSKKQVRMFIDTLKSKSAEITRLFPSSVEDNEQILDEPENPFHLQACAAFMFHKLLSNEQYGIGNILARSLKDYNHSFSDVEKSVKILPLPMKNAMIMVREVVDNLYKDFNLGRKEMEKVMPYCRITVEKFIFDKIENIIYPIYNHKVSEQLTIFEEKRNKIFNTRRLKDLFADINLEQQLWFFQDSFKEKLEQYIDKTFTRKELRSSLKYRKGCEQLQKMSHVTSPREKMKHCQLAYSVLKTVFYQGTNKARQLSNMQEIIPVFIIVLLLSDIPELKGQLDLIIDFIQFDNCDLQSERRLLLNLSESFNYIYRDWKV